jgi:RimJ/RimL family protein N-acetyltransferase
VTLEPLSLRHHGALCRVGLDPALWRWTWAPVTTPEALTAYIETALAEQARGVSLPFAVVHHADGPVGSTRYGNIALEHRRLEIGWTWVGRAYQGTGVNAEAKLLLLTHAFERLGCARVELKTNALNAQSRGAMEKMGARFEGIFRKHGIQADGTVRDTAWYSIVDDEWPAVKAGLEARVRSATP